MKKTIFLSLCLMGLIINKSFAQDFKEAMSPIFYAYAEKNIVYPVGAIRGSIYGRIYASFEVNTEGKVNNVNVIYPLVSKTISKKLGFEAEIVDGLSKTPHLNNVRAGKYVLPIAFVYRNMYYGDEIYPTNKISEGGFSDEYQFLKEIKITARSDQYRSLRNFSGIPPMSRQIVEY